MGIRGKLLVSGLVLVFVTASAALGTVGCRNAERVRGEAEAFLEALRRGDVSGAYGRLSSRRRAAMPFETFDALTDHPAFRAHAERGDGRLDSRGDGTCFHGHLAVDGGEWVVELFVVDEGGTPRVQSFAIQRPARVQLGMLLEECGFWEGTLVGYSGPPIERTTEALGD